MPFQAMAIYDIFLFTVQNYKKMPASAWKTESMHLRAVCKQLHKRVLS